MQPPVSRPWALYRAVWGALAAVVATIGVAGACVLLGVGDVLLLGGSAAALATLLGPQVQEPAQRRGRAVPTMVLALAAGVASLAGTGLAMELGPAGLGLGVLLAAAGWPVLRRPGPASRRFPPARTAEQPIPPALETLGPAPASPIPATARSTTPALDSWTTAELCWAWRTSYVQVHRAVSAVELDRLAQLRRGYLDELQRRDPQAFSRWFPAARAASDPARFFGRQPQT